MLVGHDAAWSRVPATIRRFGDRRELLLAGEVVADVGVVDGGRAGAASGS